MKRRVNNFISNIYNILFIEFLILVLISSKYIFENDEGIWSYIGRVWHRNGILPYVGTVENKTPIIYYLHYLSDFLFGINFIFVRFLGILSALITSYFLYKISTYIRNKNVGLIASWLYCLLISWQVLDGFTMGSTEIFMNLFSTIGIYYFILFIKDKSSLNIAKTAFAFCIAIQTKQIALVSLIGVIIFFIYLNFVLKSNFIKNSFWLIFGLLIGFIFSFIPLFISNISLTDYFKGSWLILLNPGSSLNTFQGRIIQFINVFIFSKFFIVYLIFIFLLFNRKKYFKNLNIQFLIVLFIFDFFAINSSGTYSGHQLKQIVPVLSILLSIILYDIYLLEFSNYWGFNKYIFFIILIFFPYDQIIYSMYNSFYNKHKTYYNSLILKNYLKTFYPNTKYIYIFGNCKTINPILSISGKISPIKNFNNYFLHNRIDLNIAYNEFRQNPPEILFNEENYNIKDSYSFEFDYFVKKKYHFIKKVNDFYILQINNNDPHEKTKYD